MLNNGKKFLLVDNIQIVIGIWIPFCFISCIPGCSHYNSIDVLHKVKGPEVVGLQLLMKSVLFRQILGLFKEIDSCKKNPIFVQQKNMEGILLSLESPLNLALAAYQAQLYPIILMSSMASSEMKPVKQIRKLKYSQFLSDDSFLW